MGHEGNRRAIVSPSHVKLCKDPKSPADSRNLHVYCARTIIESPGLKREVKVEEKVQSKITGDCATT